MTAEKVEDALSALAPLLRVRPRLDNVCRLGGSWSAVHEHAQSGYAYFHIVVRGRATLDRSEGFPLDLGPGDILLLPHGNAHTMHAPGMPALVPSPVTTRRQGSFSFRTSLGAVPDVELVCGRLHFEAAPENLIVAALPDVIVLRVGEQPLTTRFDPLLAGIREELDGERAGALAIAENLATALFVMMLRSHLEASAPVEGLLRLLGQRTTAQAVTAMLRDPVHAWTLDELAHAAAASRATLVRAFRKAAGIAPLEFLMDLRLGLARQRLRTAHASLDQIAADAGYQSQGAFSRAFLRRYGVRPGQVRQDARVSAAT
ncbi:AraC family transcriptional regulator [Methylobacterium sp. Leaf86]|uniref:AraC family transcriptional regulator n=1 Tax=Methylobacterium sp. Leaf86 TaxID=1736242 RepID=UPI0006F46E61|nr:AraC family transcriptional regulator [Methylobacterium sp. Leaf86]KQO45450.1 AraC family transcriptional regulator [Methylobacterium sp. Leaf86]